ncbi:MAG: phosphoadenosine phosphosulfate reductase [Candidatus Lambdaproteobacteria bacterium RIFOXYD1_FULL_56_27]|uniref:Adenosine 5'-phosphosulfate reductase n=1 Tax=Candidatus Lambdaproteobacteria bacterium RIFOXYD2_FULL_56_26 TaxID=1817773 RepID=A0A1F6H2T6_9PROT|nr:MAG: phosphoadenosine phosphosulfate reductase [Candidatus Lambdaproteobacteria bacterium RIFOXYD2_FULL_56_26]OGH05312.1 MAG: phosphoadenosine phosphosulfate reductase [Candidatus Lambdaproteobacteria bacterium RIFOXYC1_FULL_56_13]OGH09153.1 MAG: phosphoadenosine phosphosulfate reductase [Candidatus Lambdaproteobacteria bacterium RIFOXYD1_FULL_56_27]
MKAQLEAYQAAVQGLSPAQAMAWALREFGVGQVALASSFGLEDQLLTQWLVELEPKARVFTLDTGRLFQETYECMGATQKKLGLSFEVYFPDPQKVKELYKTKGPNSFYESVANRKECCGIRKVEPLGKALFGLKLWITGQRRDQSLTRAALETVEWDEAHGLFKLNPLADWTEEQVWARVLAEEVPYNSLHDLGFPSIGCLPCTRKVEPGQEARAGRWWWEEPEHKECGLHSRPK